MNKKFLNLIKILLNLTLGFRVEYSSNIEIIICPIISTNIINKIIKYAITHKLEWNIYKTSDIHIIIAPTIKSTISDDTK
jgi:hypothetical protein